MPFTSQDFEQISPERMNPLIAALNYANQNRDLGAKIAEARARTGLIGAQQTQADLANQKLQKLLPFVTPEEQALLQQKQAAAKQATNIANNQFMYPGVPPEVAKLIYFQDQLQRQGQQQQNGQSTQSPLGGMSLIGGGDVSPNMQSQQRPQMIQNPDHPNTNNKLQQAYNAAWNETIYGNKQSPEQQRNVAQENTNQQQINKQTEELASDRDTLINGLQALENFHQNYQEGNKHYLSRQGSFGGTLPATGLTTILGNYDRERNMDNNSSYLQGDFAQHLSPRMTNLIVKLAGAAKINRDMDPGTEENTYNKIKSAFVRGIEQQEAMNYMSDLKIPYKKQQELWTLYNTNMPIYNAKDGKYNDKNVNQFQNFMKVDDGKIVIHKADGWYEL